MSKNEKAQTVIKLISIDLKNKEYESAIHMSQYLIILIKEIEAEANSETQSDP